MSPERARRYLLMVERAWAGARLCSGRVEQTVRAAPPSAVVGLEDFPDLSSDDGHDVDYYTFEIYRIVEIARDMLTMRSCDRLAPALAAVEAAAPRLRSFRNAITHPMDRPLSADVDYQGAAIQFAVNGDAELLLDPRDYDLTLAMHELVAAILSELGA